MTDALDDIWESLDDPEWLAKSKRKQDAARASVEADDELAEPSRDDRLAAYGQGVAESLSMGGARDLVDVVKADSPQSAGGAAAMLAAAPFGLPAMGMAARYASPQTSGAHDADVEAASKGKRGALYGLGHLVGDLGGAALGGAESVGSAVKAARAGTLSSTFKPVAEAAAKAKDRLGAAGREMAAEAVDGNVPSKLGALKRAISALTGDGGDASKLVVESTPAPSQPWMTVLADDVGSQGGPASGLELARQPRGPSNWVASADDLARDNLPPQAREAIDASRSRAVAAKEGREAEREAGRAKEAAKRAEESGDDLFGPDGDRLTGQVQAPATPAPAPTVREQALDDLLVGPDAPPPARSAPEVAASQAKLDPKYADMVADGSMTPRQAGAATRNAATKANAPRSGGDIKEQVRAAYEADPKVTPQQLKKRLGINIAAAKRELDNVKWGR
jgi:hypothetical protein